MPPQTTAIVFTTDHGYLVPTLVAAEQVLGQITPQDRCDVLIFTLDLAVEELCELELMFPHIRFIPLPSITGALDVSVDFNPTHVPRSAMARLTLNTVLPPEYTQILYLDGDIQIVGDIRPLIRYRVPKGMVLAGCDHAEINWSESGRYAKVMRNYITGLKITRGRDYFNSGVLAAQRDTWQALTAEALAFFNQHSELCQFHDQSALNAVARTSRIPLHPRYNFVSWFRWIGGQDWVSPAILHFTGGQKPWANTNPAANGAFRGTYVSMAARSPYLAAAFERTSGLHVPNSSTRKLSTLMPWRALTRRRRFVRFLREAPFPFL